MNVNILCYFLLFWCKLIPVWTFFPPQNEKVGGHGGESNDTKFLSLILSTERLPAPAADLVARRIRARTRRRKKSAATALRRTRIAAGVAAPRAKRPRKKERRARRMIPGPGLAPGLALDQELRIALGNLDQLAAISRRVMTKEASLRGALAPVHAPPLNPSPEPGLNQSPNPNPAPRLLQKLAPTPDPPPVQSPAPNPAPSLVPAPVPALSSDFGLFVMSPYPSVSPCPPFTFPKPQNTTPASCLLINSCRIPGTLLDVLYAHATPFHSTFTLPPPH